MKRILAYIAKLIVDQLVERLGIDRVRVEAVNAKPGDLIIVSCDFDYELSPEARERLAKEWEVLFPANKVVVTKNVRSLSVIHAAEKKPGGMY